MYLPEQSVIMQVLNNDPDLACPYGQARETWEAIVETYLPYCAIWRRDFKGLKQDLLDVWCLYNSLEDKHPELVESELRQKLYLQYWQEPGGCKREACPSDFFTE